jgi:hypothetical protein
MSVDVVVALVSVIVGYGGSVITAELQNRRIRERAREYERRRFQRETLMKLQEHVAHLMGQNQRSS